MQTNFMFLFLAFFLIVALSTFDPDGSSRKSSHAERPVPLATISHVEPVQKEEASPLDDLPYLVHTTEVEFRKGKLTLGPQAREEIRETFERARQEGKIRAAKIISWADLPLPARKKTHGSDQLKLVEDRNDQLEGYLEKLDFKLNVGKISMVERKEVMNELLSPEDRKLREVFENSETENLSKSIVLFILKDEEGE